MATSTPFVRSLVIQFRVIGALLMREVLTRYGRHNIGFLWLFAEPMMFTLGIAGLWSLIREGHTFNLPIVAFAVTGYSTVLLWRNMPSRCCTAIEPNLALMYHRNVKVIDVFAARVLLEIAGTTSSFVILSLIFMALDMMRPPENILQVLIGWFLIAWFGASLALTIGAFAARSEIVEKIWHPLAYLIFPLSGAAFMVDWLPPVFQKAALLIPMVNGIEFLREGYFGSVIHAHYSLPYLAGWAMCLTLFGLSQARIVSREVLPE